MSLQQAILCGLTAVFTILTFLPFIKSPKWFIRVWDYPRFQMFGIILVVIILSIPIIEWNETTNLICISILFLDLIYLSWMVYPYSTFSKKMVEKESSQNPKYSIKLLTCNVYQYNKHYIQTLHCIYKSNPDVVFLLETDKNWRNSVQVLKEKYPYAIEIPKENTYGMLFYSKFPIKQQTINYLIDDEIPSIIVDLNVHGKTVRLYGIHPTPPVPQENPESTDRDAEILIVGKKSKDFDGPSIVFGDLNDVAWSHTTRLFLRISGMLDPRIGRGMYSTFHAKYSLLRWPLDHFFVSSHFRLIDLKVEDFVNSDHFPISVTLSLRTEDKEKELEASADDVEEANEIIEEAKEK